MPGVFRHIPHVRSGFSLIELLVVIAIIGILATVAVMSFSNARMKARDARRIADLKQIRDALELFFDENGYYPGTACGWDCNGYLVSYNATWDSLRAPLSPYLKVPVDPINSTCIPFSTSAECYSYAYGNVGRYTYQHRYDLFTRLEDPNHPARCEVMQYRWGLNGTSLWCGSYPGQLYEASPI